MLVPSVPVPRSVPPTPPSQNFTEPVGLAPPAVPEVMVAVRVTGWPKPDGFGDDVTVVVVEAAFTTWVTLPLPELKLLSPLYSAVMVRLPPGNWKGLVVKVATPPLSATGPPRMVLPSLNVTVPVGVPLPPVVGATVAVKVTDWP